MSVESAVLQDKAVVIGASAGGVDALSRILPTLPKDFPLPIFVVVHVPADKKSVLPELLQAKCQIKVCEAEDKEMIQGGTAYFAPPDYHLLVEQDGYLSLSSDDAVMYSRPSIDVLFESAADAYGENLIGIVLTGGNSDGSLGLKAVRNAGGVTVVQTPATAYATNMPQAALQACPDAEVMNLEHIAEYLQGVRP